MCVSAGNAFHLSASDEGAVAVDGDVMTGLLEADFQQGRTLAGVTVAFSEGEGGFGGPSSGDIESALTSLHPYMRLSVWSVLGYGSGKLSLTRSGETQAAEADIDLTMGAVGLRGALLSGAESGGLRDREAGLTVGLRSWGLIAHEDGPAEEWSVGGSLRLEPEFSGRGPSLRLAPSLSDGPRRRAVVATRYGRVGARRGCRDLAQRLDAELGYGLAGPGGVGVMTPYTGPGLADGGTRTLRVGARWRVAPSFPPGSRRTACAVRPRRRGRARRDAVGHAALLGRAWRRRQAGPDFRRLPADAGAMSAHPLPPAVAHPLNSRLTEGMPRNRPCHHVDRIRLRNACANGNLHMLLASLFVQNNNEYNLS